METEFVYTVIFVHNPFSSSGYSVQLYIPLQLKHWLTEAIIDCFFAVCALHVPWKIKCVHHTIDQLLDQGLRHQV